MTTKSLAERFEALDEDYRAVILTRFRCIDALGGDSEFVDSAKNNNWIARAKKLLEDSYGKESDYYVDFNNTAKVKWSTNYEKLVRHYKPLFDAARDDLENYPANINTMGNTALEWVIGILERFPAFCRQLEERHDGRATFEINDEYDVQDLVHALLMLHFDDIREEEASPSHAGASSRQDFILKKERIVIEVKKTRKSLNARKIGEELIIDMSRYRAHPDCETLICFVYDPDRRVKNPKGLISDLERGDKEGKTRVVIAQF
ncbi:malate dehydrogenase [Pantoea agglomerans]|uniref:PD-(D/E)XK nuclease domain-containing protein n=1 Tax=Enterobacter agglomerans TaxID=549 RepID=UPI0013B6AF52|nr:malate dehydrogenase [Pantoea agglomerans]NEG87261.1 malate dehydrogenase [Pantoea agglomerans]NEH09595.1 malate dehydrogenase [Pantoea agglomerans]